MFKKLTLQNWKSFRYAELPIDSLTILIGTNASGKSNVVDAFEFLKRVINRENINSVLSGNSGIKPIRGGIENIFHRNSSEFSLQLLMNDFSQILELDYNITVSSSKSLVKYREEKKIFKTEADGRKKQIAFPLLSLLAFQNKFKFEEIHCPSTLVETTHFSGRL